jgi:hypothetical protein
MTLFTEATYFIRSLNSGDDWEPFITLDDTSGAFYQSFSEIVKNGPNLIIGFMGYLSGQGFNPGYFRSTDFGETWGPLNEIFPYYDSDLNHYSSFSNYQQRIYASYRNFERDSIYVIRSTDWGDSWNGRGVNVAYLSSTPQPMTVRAWGDNVYLVWVNEIQPISCRYSRCTDMGYTWSDEIEISDDSLGAQRVYIAVENTHVVVCWMGYKYSPYSFTGDLFIRQSFDFGETWGDEQVLTDLHKVRRGYVYCEDSLIVATWMDQRYQGGGDEVMVKISYNYGMTWTDEERISYGEGHSYDPISCKTGDKIHLLWGDIRPDAPGLYYRVNDPSTSIDETEVSHPNKIYISSHPNPFNARTIITYSGMEGGNIEIYDITGSLIKTLTISGKGGEIIWDATDERGRNISSGVYFIKARKADSDISRKVVFIK